MLSLPRSLRDALTYSAMPAAAGAAAAPSAAARPVTGRSRSGYLAAAIVALLLAACALPARHASPTPHDWRAGLRGVAVIDPILDSHLRRMRAWSPAFDSAMAEVERSEVPVVIGTDAQLGAALPVEQARWNAWQALQVIFPLPRDGRARPIERAAVIVRLGALQASLHSASDSALFPRQLETLLAHEVYGHLVPQLRTGRTAPVACADEREGELPFDACVVRREQRVVAQLNASRYAMRAPSAATLANDGR